MFKISRINTQVNHTFGKSVQNRWMNIQTNHRLSTKLRKLLTHDKAWLMISLVIQFPASVYNSPPAAALTVHFSDSRCVNSVETDKKKFICLYRINYFINFTQTSHIISKFTSLNGIHLLRDLFLSLCRSNCLCSKNSCCCLTGIHWSVGQIRGQLPCAATAAAQQLSSVFTIRTPPSALDVSLSHFLQSLEVSSVTFAVSHLDWLSTVCQKSREKQ